MAAHAVAPSPAPRPSAARWEKSIVREDYRVLIKLLRTVRHEAHLTQQQLGDALGQTQTFVSKAERGERRLDLVETRLFCRAMNLPFDAFVARLEQFLSE